jgi:transcriptional regulator with XRE-family HTH domain
MTFDKILHQIMHERRLSQLALSRMLGIRQSQISNWVAGKTLPNYTSIKLLCEKLNLSADELLDIKA